MKQNKKGKVGLEKNTLWAKVIVVILTIFVVWLSLYKFSIYLNEPKVTFAKALKSFNNDFKEILNDLESVSLYNLLNSNGLEINSDIKIDSSNLVGSLRGLDNTINSLDFAGNIRINKSSNYLSAKFKMRKDSIDKMNLDYLLRDGKKYIYSSNFSNSYIKLDNGHFDLFDIKKEDSITISNVLESEIVKFIDKKKFFVNEMSIAINNKTIDCDRIHYILSDRDINLLIENVVYSLQSNEKAIKYLNGFLGEEYSDFNNMVKKIKNVLGIDSSDEFELAVYISQTSEDAVRLELTSINGNSKIAFNKDFNFEQLDISKNGISNIITLEGSLKNKYILTLSDNEKVLTLISTNNDDGRAGKISKKMKDDSSVNFNCDFSYMINSSTDNLRSLSANLNFTLNEKEEAGTLNVNISSLINDNIEIDEIVVRDFVNYLEFKNTNQTDIKSSIINSLQTIDLNSPLSGNLPVEFTN